MLFNKYRPVSLLCILSKVFEKVMYSRLLNFLNHYKVLISNQFGFRKLHSSYMALMVMINELTNALENGDYVIGIFLDFSKAFDTVNHETLLDKLYQYGIRDNALHWFQSYLTERQQFVMHNVSIQCNATYIHIYIYLYMCIYIHIYTHAYIRHVCSRSGLQGFDTSVFGWH